MEFATQITSQQSHTHYSFSRNQKKKRETNRVREKPSNGYFSKRPSFTIHIFLGEGKLKIIKSINPTSECVASQPYKPSRMLNELRLNQTQITVVLKRINMNYINKLLYI